MSKKNIVSGLRAGLRRLAMSKEEESSFDYYKDRWICLAIGIAHDEHEISTKAYFQSTHRAEIR